MRQLQLFTSAQLATMRDRRAARNYSAEAEQFRRDHERHRAWGLARRHAERLRRVRGGACGSGSTAGSGGRGQRQVGVAGAVVGSAVDSVAGPVVDSVAGPVADSVAGPVAEPVVDSVAGAVSEPAVDSVAEPQSGPIAGRDSGCRVRVSVAGVPERGGVGICGVAGPELAGSTVRCAAVPLADGPSTVDSSEIGPPVTGPSMTGRSRSSPSVNGSPLIGSRVTYTVTPEMFVSALVQYNTGIDSVSANVRLRWEYRPGSELFLVLNEQRDTLSPRFPDLVNRAFIVKINRLVRF